MITCSIPGCKKSKKGRGYCAAHYKRWQKYGDPLKLTRPSVKLVLRDIMSQETEMCIPWPLSKSKAGYGNALWMGRHRPAHAVICEMAHGPKPPNKEAAHSCRDRSCCNKRHVMWKTRLENIGDRNSDGTTVCGETHPRAKLTLEHVRNIIADRGRTDKQALARFFGVNESAIRAIWSGRTWGRALRDTVAKWPKPP